MKGKNMTVTERKELELAAVRIREGILTSTFSAGAGHPGGSLSSAELFAWLYFKEMYGKGSKVSR